MSDVLTAKASRGPLKSLLMVIQEQLRLVAEDFMLHDDQFMETCAPWVIPYIGDLIGYQAVKESRRRSTIPAPRLPILSPSAAAKALS